MKWMCRIRYLMQYLIDMCGCDLLLLYIRVCIYYDSDVISVGVMGS